MNFERFRTWWRNRPRWDSPFMRYLVLSILAIETFLLILLFIIMMDDSNHPITMFPNHEEAQHLETSEQRERELGLASHSPEKLFPNYAAIRAYEDMNNYVVVYEKGEGACQVVVKDKNNAKDIYCYEVENQHGSIHVTHAFKRPFYNLTPEKQEMTVEHKNDGM